MIWSYDLEPQVDGEGANTGSLESGSAGEPYTAHEEEQT